MNIRKTLAVVAIAVAALSSTAHAQLNASADDLKAFTKFVIYTSICNVDETVIDHATYSVMQGLGEQLPEAERRKIGADALAEVKQEIAAATLPRFCAMYGSELTPFIRRMNEALRSLR